MIPIGGEVRQYRVAPQPGGAARARRHLRAAREGAGAVRRQYRRRLHRPAFARIPDPQYRPHHQPGRPAQPRRREPVNGGRSTCVRWRRCSFAPKPKRGDAGYMGKPAVIVSVEKQPNVDTVTLDARDREALTELTAHACRTASRPTRFCSGRPTSSKPRSTTSARAAGSRRIVVAVVLFAFLLNWRTTAISLTAIPGLDPDHGHDLPFRRACPSTR